MDLACLILKQENHMTVRHYYQIAGVFYHKRIEKVKENS